MLVTISRQWRRAAGAGDSCVARVGRRRQRHSVLRQRAVAHGAAPAGAVAAVAKLQAATAVVRADAAGGGWTAHEATSGVSGGKAPGTSFGSPADSVLLESRDSADPLTTESLLGKRLS